MKGPINLIIKEVKEFHPEPQEWPVMVDTDGLEVELRPCVILAMIPAVGWHAVFVNREEISQLLRKPLACFGLHLEDGGTQSVIGLVNGDKALIPAEWDDAFLGYEGPGEDNQEEWEYQHIEWLKRLSSEYRDIGEYDIRPNEN